MRERIGRVASQVLRSSGGFAWWQQRCGFASLPNHTKLTMPALSPTMTEGVIANWLKREGEQVRAGQSICEIETDKATVDFEVQDDGFLAKILAPAGGPARPVGSIIGLLVNEKGDVEAFSNVSADDFGIETAAPVSQPSAPPAPPAAKAAAPPAAAQASSPAPAAASQPQPQKARSGRIFASPLAKMLASQSGVGLDALIGTGPNGRILAADVKEFVAAGGAAKVPAPSPAAVAPATTPVAAVAQQPRRDAFDTPVSSNSQALAAQLEQSKRQVPHYYLNAEIDVSAMMSIRAQLNAGLGKESIAVNDILVRAAALCMQRVPDVNASWGNTFIRRYKDCDVNVAVVNADEQVVMPVIRRANAKGLAQIAAESRGLLTAEGLGKADLGVGTFTISNLGAYGVSTFTPIVREPQACSLGVGRIFKKAVPGEPDQDGKPTIKVKEVMTVTLSCDHRVVDGAVGAQWLQEFRQLVENPVSMLL